MNWPRPSDADAIDLERDVPTTREDVDVLLRLHRATPSWLLLTPDEVEALLPEDALDRRPPTPAHARPFTLPAQRLALLD